MPWRVVKGLKTIVKSGFKSSEKAEAWGAKHLGNQLWGIQYYPPKNLKKKYKKTGRV